MKKVIIGSRGSDLALWQAHFTQRELKKLGFDSEIKIIVTKGDKIQDLSFDKIEGKGFFTKEIEESLLNKEIDVAVHSHKDLETDQPEGLVISAVSYRENPADLLLINKGAVDENQKFGLKENAIVGTSSARRKNQMQFFRPDVELKDLRGNVPTRVNKLRDENYDAIILAYAGINRLELDLSDFEAVELSPKEFVPAAAQGVLAFQTREDATETNAIISKLNDPKVAECIKVERTILNQLEGGCQLPLGAYCERSEEGFNLWVSQAEKWEESPNRLYREAKTTEGLAEEILKELKKKSKIKRVFLSKDINSTSYFSRLAKNFNAELVSKSQIKITPVNFSVKEDFDWVFFSSSNAVRPFFNSQQVNNTVKYAALGEATSKELSKYIKPTFIGEGKTKAAAVQFSKSLEPSEKVLFPSSNLSQKTIQKELQPNQIVDVVSYQTELSPAKIQSCDAYVFTSPSNVEAFLSINKIPEQATVVAIGEITAETLLSKKVQNVRTAWSYNNLAFWDSI